MRLWTIPTTLLIVGIGAIAFGKSTFVKDFASTYGIQKTSKLGVANCGVCHVGKTTKLNLYGKDIQAAMKQEGTRVLTGSVLKKVEGLDSDKDDKSNLVEIRADTLPGDATSK